MENILTSWSLQELYPILKAHDINDLETLDEFLMNSSDELMKEVIPSVGLRLRLKKKFRENFGYSKNPQDEILQPAGDNKNSEIQFEHPLQDISILTVDSNLDCHSLFKIATDDGQIINPATISDEPPRKKIKTSKVSDVDLRAILQEHPIGRRLLLISKLNITLENQWQSHLSEIIALHFINKDIILTNEDIEDLSMKIIEVFPLESSRTYYVVPVKKCDSKENKSWISKGKLIYKYRNINTTIRTLEKLSEGSNNEDLDTTEINNSAIKSKEWLRYNRETQEDIFTHWDLSYDLRQQEINDKKYQSATDIFNDWPILKEEGACALVKRDFNKNYPDSVNTVAPAWNHVFNQLMKKFYNKLSNEKKVRLTLIQLSDEHTSVISKCMIQLELLAAILPPKQNKIFKKKRITDKTQWKPTIEEAVKGIVEHVKIPGDINEIVEKKISFMAKLKRTVQPYLIVVGQYDTHLDKVYVQIDNFRYQVSSFLEGLDVLFQFYITFNLAYPTESENIWYFIQWAMYNIETKSDTQIPAIYNIINKLKKNQK